jgi:chromosome partitioning protein
MPIIIAIASAKGGCGKTTLAILLGTELALDGHRTRVLDADMNQHAAAFGQAADITGFSVAADITETNVLPAIRQAEADGMDVIIIDLPGGSSVLALKAMQRAHLVLIPMQASLPDVKDAVKTIAQVDDAGDAARYTIARALVWTRVPAGFESLSARHVRQHVEGLGLPLFHAALMERAAYREMHLTGRPPRQADGKGAAAATVTALTAELLRRLAEQEAAQ